MRLLLVEDDELLGDAVKTGLTQFGYIVDWLKDGEAARAALKSESFELIILDLGLPKLIWLVSYCKASDMMEMQLLLLF